MFFNNPSSDLVGRAIIININISSFIIIIINITFISIIIIIIISGFLAHKKFLPPSLPFKSFFFNRLSRIKNMSYFFFRAIRACDECERSDDGTSLRSTSSVTWIHVIFFFIVLLLFFSLYKKPLSSTFSRLFSSNHPFSLSLSSFLPSILPFPPRPKLRCSICIYHQSIVIVNYNYYKRLHEIINSDKMSEKKTIIHGCVLFCHRAGGGVCILRFDDDLTIPRQKSRD